MTGKKKTKTIFSLLGLLLLLFSIPLTLRLVEQRQEIREKAVSPTIIFQSTFPYYNGNLAGKFQEAEVFRLNSSSQAVSYTHLTLPTIYSV